MRIAKATHMRTLLLVALLAGCRAHTQVPAPQLGESKATGPTKPVIAPSDNGPDNLDVPISGAPKVGPNDPPVTADPPPDVP